MLYAILIALLLVGDQWVKYWVSANITLGTGSEPLIPGVVKLVNFRNSGASFGILEDSPYARWLFVGIAAVFVVIVIIVLAKKVFDSRFATVCCSMAIAGAMGNCIDRVIYGYVVDMFKVEFMNFAVFNVADVILVLSFVMFIIFLLAGERVEDGDGEETDKEPEPVKLRSAVSLKTPAADENIAVAGIESEDAPEDTDGLDDDEFWSSLKSVTVKRSDDRPAPKPVRKPEPKAMPKVKPEPKAATEDFDLESILNEFKDL